jgi:hypothetical protein
MHVEISSAMYLAGVLFVCVPCLWTVYAAKRDRQLAVAKLEVSRIITQYNKLLLGEEIRGGQVCHNEVYGLMLAVQAMSSYPMPRVHSDESEAAARMRKAIEQEVAEGPKELRDLLAKFVVYYYILVSLRHPVQTKVYTLRHPADAYETMEALLCEMQGLRDELSDVKRERDVALAQIEHNHKGAEMLEKMVYDARQERDQWRCISASLLVYAESLLAHIPDTSEINWTVLEQARAMFKEGEAK